MGLGMDVTGSNLTQSDAAESIRPSVDYVRPAALQNYFMVSPERLQVLQQ